MAALTQHFAGLWALGAMLLGGLAHASSELKVVGNHFEDPYGRTIVLRGFNVSGRAKRPPFIPLKPRKGNAPDLTELDRLPSIGTNAIRLLFIWEAYEPEFGKYNSDYLNMLASVVDAAWAKGIFTIIDFHQDGYSRYAAGGCGAGFPEWTVPIGDRHPPVNSNSCGSLWATKQVLNPAMHSSFNGLYSDFDGVRQAYLRVLGRLGAFFRSHPGVIGYDLLNEPWGSEKTELPRLYEDAASSLRAQDPSAILFFEPHITVASGMVQTSLPRPRFNNAVYAPHYYDFLALAAGLWDSYVSPPLTQHAFKLMLEVANEWNVPLLLGEYGALGTMESAPGLLDLQQSLLDQNFFSATQWNFTPEWTPIEKDGWNQEDLSVIDHQKNWRINLRLRPYALAVAGYPIRQESKFDSRGRFSSYEFNWQHDPKRGVTELFVPREMLASAELWLESNKNLHCTLSRARARLACTSDTRGFKHVALKFTGVKNEK